MNYSDIVNHVNVYGLEESIRGAKFPMSTDVEKLTTDLTPGIKKLATSAPGEGHSTWLQGVIVQFDLTFTVKAWTEAQRYHFLDFISSQSTMHRITRFDLDKSYISYVDQRIIDIMKERVKEYNEVAELINNYKDNHADESKIQSLVEEQKRRYLEILYSNPAGFRLTARMTTNYRQLQIIYRQRRTHRLPEWRAFCEWVKTLPHSEFITGDEVTTDVQ